MLEARKRPIGVFDSGLGGLTVVKELTRVLPHEDIIYFGDTARVPYGTRSAEIIRSFSEENTRFLLQKRVKAVVIACNTSSAVAAVHLKNKFKNIPIFEVIEPASIEATEKGKKIGVIGTYTTIGSLAYNKSIKKHLKNAEVFGSPCPLFVPFIEEGETKGKSLKIMAEKYLKGLKKQKIDTLILGCTHYPIIKDVIEAVMGKGVTLINPGKSVTGEIYKFLKENDLFNNQKRNGDIKFFVTDLTERFTKVAEMFLGKGIRKQLEKVEL
ncbi:MAG: Glutamate racemase [Candidatus Woesebacteria bacterium GW2011_GWB1_40_12]|uniref:Glutamate racemase n=1 Tax=Candidatus Woesebacteria bacterium GW2011_GWB1_40_12 TaxID=1618576 RepID=A0A0G0T2U5_9BACT|nr:MAG: Glutamate racemase [Candidatus Woesebacteria bacterium GW2011_GWB1_40_12]